ncbi:DUF3800 domain-containing protein [Streptomyces aurantiogriseus]|uniref:DUF3800 domain-containing protein n=1 Tax=Streptomyces aurantiogriseus TaxID=66870 RepID=A0A918FLH9_9ACTN|nr:DUF3800 domain-containing protein [Streptomyces aurantiogriseus]GGR51557.1 hypothetical protein GCM10010251_80700 [Streptomyces aurantiogriseus]
MATPTVYADESSSTGENLLDPDQPVFCAAAVHLDDSLAQQTVEDVKAHLPSTHGEPKYTALSQTGTGRDALIAAFDTLVGESILAFIANKRFMVVTKMVDVLVEELAHETGFNLYDGDAALGLANLYHLSGPVLGDPGAYDRMLQTFVDAVRRRSRASAADLFAAISTYRATTKPPLTKWVELLECTRAQGDDIIRRIASGEMRDVLDPAIPCLAVVCGEMGKIVGEFALVHDESNAVARGSVFLQYLHWLPDPARPGLMMERLPVTSVAFSDSTAAPQLQIADWAAGAVRQWATSLVTTKRDPFAERLEPFVKRWTAGGIWPDPDFFTTGRKPIGRPEEPDEPAR